MNTTFYSLTYGVCGLFQKLENQLIGKLFLLTSDKLWNMEFSYRIKNQFEFYDMKCSRFRITQWDCLLTLGKIISIQFFAYFFLGLVMLLISLAIGNNFSLSLLFQYHVVQGTVLGGTAITSVFIINSVLCAILLWAVVKRAKQCLDFSCTFHGFHLLVCWWYNSTFPTNLSWWLLNAITSAIMCIGGEFLCLKSELNKIPIGYTALNEKSDV